MGQRTEFTFEVEETVLLKQGGKILCGYCPHCDRELDLVSPDVLSLVTGSSEREIFRLVETGAIYFVETERLIVCPQCFSRSMSRQADDGTQHMLED